MSALHSANHCQGQLQTPQSITVIVTAYNIVTNISEIGQRMEPGLRYYINICQERIRIRKEIRLGQSAHRRTFRKFVLRFQNTLVTCSP
jgi:hypothetical protein